MKFKAPRGTRDILPDEAGTWFFVEKTIREISRSYGYGEIRTPLFEHTEVFSRGVGEDTDIVSREMYNFKDRGDREITLRPEGTAAVVRAYLEHNFYAVSKPVKLYYYGPMFRYDRPQSGRYRQFNQFGVECFGAAGAAADVEIISLGIDFLSSMGLDDTTLHLNSVGCSLCRDAYLKKLLDNIEPSKGKLCESCRHRFQNNPLRILDCKEEGCRSISAEVPEITGYLCRDCLSHFEQVQLFLEKLGISYVLNPRMVRGLEYYTRTAFEFVSNTLSEAQNALGGGGRYDNLVEIFGGPPDPAVGMAMGIERIILSLKEKERDRSLLRSRYPRVFIAVDGESQLGHALKLAGELRVNGPVVEVEYLGRSLKAQMKYAGKQGFDSVVIAGERELKKDKIIFKKMDTGTQEMLTLPELKKKLDPNFFSSDKEDV